VSAGGLLRTRGTFVFDLDGTLVDTLPDLARALNEALSELGEAPVPASLVRRSLHGGLEASAAEALRYLCLDPQAAEPLALAYTRHYARAPAQDSRSYAGVPELLARLAGDGARLAVCTNKPLAQAEAVLAATGLGGFFPVVVGADCCGRRKPDPEPVRHALARLGGTPADALMVGDSLADVRSAHGAGVACLLHLAGYGEVPSAEPGVIARFGSYPELLESMG
jgi:2-phosphoglycolate phosphatase